MGKTSSSPQLLVFIVCQHAAQLAEPFLYEIGQAFMLYPVRTVPCTVRGFAFFVEFSGGTGQGSIRFSLHRPSDDEVVWERERPIRFKGQWNLKQFCDTTGEFDLPEVGRYRFEVSLDGISLAVRPITVVAPAPEPG